MVLEHIVTWHEHTHKKRTDESAVICLVSSCVRVESGLLQDGQVELEASGGVFRWKGTSTKGQRLFYLLGFKPDSVSQKNEKQPLKQEINKRDYSCSHG